MERPDFVPSPSPDGQNLHPSSDPGTPEADQGAYLPYPNSAGVGDPSDADPSESIPAHPSTASPLHPLRPLGRGTLGRRLVVRVTALVAAVAIVLASATTLAARQLLVHNIDDQLNVSFSRILGPTGGPGGPPGRRAPSERVNLPGNPIGTVAVLYDPRTGIAIGGALDESGQGTLLTQESADALGRVTPDGSERTQTLPDLGRYRVMAVQLGGAVLVVGLPMAQVDSTLSELIILAVLVTVLAVIAALLIAREVVVRSLRPLHRLAGTAQEVSRLELSRGEVHLPVRADPSDANPDSEVGQVGQALNHMLHNVEGALAARQASETKVRQFVADASHELRNPLASIRGYAELTRRGRDALPPDAAFAMGRVESEAERMSRLVEDLLLLARLDANADGGPNAGQELSLTRVDLTAVVLNAVADARVAGPDHQWALELPPEPVFAVADLNRLHQVVANLLGNARTHTPAGTRVVTGVGFEPATDGHPLRALISVTDDGPGIPPEIVDTVFERFTRADTARSRGGKSRESTGLGLAIVSAVMHAHGGTAEVTSRPGATRFMLRLPVG